MSKLSPTAAREILARIAPDTRPDFHALRFSQVAEILGAAEAYGYRAPREANGSRARYFYAYLKRRAEKDT